MYKIKRSINGEISRYKTRLCAKGYSQQEITDYNETFSPTRYDSIKLFLAIANQLNYSIVQVDVKTTFLNGELQEEIFTTPSQGINYYRNTN